MESSNPALFCLWFSEEDLEMQMKQRKHSLIRLLESDILALEAQLKYRRFEELCRAGFSRKEALAVVGSPEG